MLKKNYQKPNAKYIAFYSKEEITSDMPLAQYANDSDNDGEILSGTIGGGSMEPGIK